VLEAAFEGTPSAAISSGGYLETVRAGLSGVHAASDSPEDLATAILRAREISAAACREWARGFGLDAHVAQLGRVIEEVVQRA
jgi:glycosyltransferase involved in cell wall biosynthesis